MATSHASPKVVYQLDSSDEIKKLPFYQCAVELFRRNDYTSAVGEDNEESLECQHVQGVGQRYENDNMVLFRSPEGLTLYVSCIL